jgi:hypothetical protein
VLCCRAQAESPVVFREVRNAGSQPGGSEFLDCLMDASGNASEHRLTDSGYKKACELAAFQPRLALSRRR